MESIQIAATIVGLIDNSSKTAQSLLQLKGVDNETKCIALEISLSLQKILVWQENWSDQARNSKVSAKILWGVQGWSTIRTLLDKIVTTGKKIETLLQVELKERQMLQPRLRWKWAMESVVGKRRIPRQHDLQDLASALNKSVDELWLISETVFDSLHGLLAIKSKSTERDTLVQSALQSRAGSLKLYELCLSQAEDCNLEMDLLDGGMAWEDLKRRKGGILELTYSLVTEPQERELQKIAVKAVHDIEIPDDEIPKSIDPGISDFQLFHPRSPQAVIIVPQHKQGSQHYLRIAHEQPSIVRLRSNPESLAKVLQDMEKTTRLSTNEYLSPKQKVKLALKVAECGFFLLGTPWFSSLSSGNLRRSNNAERELSFMLRTQILDYKDLVSDDPGALAETAQLFRLGVILMEVALDAPDDDKHCERLENDLSRIGKLPLVEKAMGSLYCKATAFCLQYRSDRFPGPEKYEGKLYAEWEKYLARFLEDYHSQVYLRQVPRSEGKCIGISTDANPGCKI